MQTSPSFGLTFVLTLTLGACAQSSADLDPSALCAQTVAEYAELRDDPSKSLEYGDLFTKDGSFIMGPNIIRGQDALIARHKSSNQSTVWNHVMDDINISDDLTGQSRVIVYTSDRKSADDITRVIIADYQDRYEIVEGVCLISERKVSVVYDTHGARIIPTAQ